MTIFETPEQPKRRKRGQPEMKLQAECFRMAWNDFPVTRKLLFHVENELSMAGDNAIRGAIRRSEGIVKGVADLILLIPNRRHHGLMIEIKTPDGYQSGAQKEWEKLVTAVGYRYEVIRSVEDFRSLLLEYLAQN
jgi:hypothetical protein